MQTNNTLIKICGVMDADTAAKTAQLGADYIGIMFYTKSKRYVDIAQAKVIAQTIKSNGAEPVAVFVDNNAKEMLEICQSTGIRCVQLHGDLARQEHVLLPASLQRIFVCPISNTGQLTISSQAAFKALDKSRDFLLLDTEKPGTGTTFTWQNFKYSEQFPWFLAGGLNPANVAQGIQQLDPQGVDISSGVENIEGKKDLTLIRNFITAVRAFAYD